jgi:hypothetical protein
MDWQRGIPALTWALPTRKRPPWPVRGVKTWRSQAHGALPWNPGLFLTRGRRYVTTMMCVPTESIALNGAS